MQSVNGMSGNRGQLIDKTGTSEELDNDFMNELNQFEFEINNERQRRHSQQRNQYSSAEQPPSAATTTSRSNASGKKIVRKKRHSKPRPDDDGGGGSSSAGGSRKPHYRSATKAGKVKKDDQMDEYSSSPYSSDEERYSSGPESPLIFDDEYQSTEMETPFKKQQQQQYDANSKNGHFVEATNLLSESEPYTQQEYYAINEQFDERISTDGGRIVDDETDLNLDLAPNFQSKNDSEKGSVQNIDSTDIGSPSTDHTFHKEQSLTSEVSTDVIDDSASAAAKDQTKSTESGSSETPTFKSRMNKVLSQDSQDSNGGLGSSKWKLLKTLKEKRIEEKVNQEKIKEEENANKEKTSVSRCVTKLIRKPSILLHISIYMEQQRSTKKIISQF